MIGRLFPVSQSSHLERQTLSVVCEHRIAGKIVDEAVGKRRGACAASAQLCASSCWFRIGKSTAAAYATGVWLLPGRGLCLISDLPYVVEPRVLSLRSRCCHSPLQVLTIAWCLAWRVIASGLGSDSAGGCCESLSSGAASIKKPEASMAWALKCQWCE